MVSLSTAPRGGIVGLAVILTFTATMIVVLKSTAAFAACALPSGTTSGSCSYSGTGSALTITDTSGSGTPYAIAGAASGKNGRAIYGNATGLGGFGAVFMSSAPTSNANNTAIWGKNAGGSTTAEGNYGSAGAFHVTNAQNESPAVSVITNGINSYALSVVNTGTIDNTVTYGLESDLDFGGIAGYFEINSAAAQFGQAAIYARHSGGEVGTGHNGRYGNAGMFIIDNTNNFDSALVGKTRSLEGTGVEGDDLSSGTDGGIGVLGISTNGLSAEFQGGSGGTGTCSYDGSAGWNCPSDRNLKTDFQEVDLGDLLTRLEAMPVLYYRMKHAVHPARYLGPTSQDFKAAFDLGKDDRTINTANAQGVALAAAKGLYQKLKKDEAKIAALEADNAALKQALAEQKGAMADRVVRLEATVARMAQGAAAVKQANLAR